jgi:hypothetical protein
VLGGLRVLGVSFVTKRITRERRAAAGDLRL